MRTKALLIALSLAVAAGVSADHRVSDFRVGPDPSWWSLGETRIASGAGVHLATWILRSVSRTGAAQVRLVGEDGSPLGVTLQTIGGNADSVAAVWNGTTFYVVSVQPIPRFGPLNTTLTSTHVDAGGRVLHTSQRTFGFGQGSGLAGVAWNGESYLVARPFGALLLVDRDSRVAREVPTTFRSMAVVARGSGFVVAGVDDTGLHLFEYSRRADLIGSALIDTGSIPSAVLATHDDEVMVAWRRADGRVRASIGGEEAIELGTSPARLTAAGHDGSRWRIAVEAYANDGIVLPASIVRFGGSAAPDTQSAPAGVATIAFGPGFLAWRGSAQGTYYAVLAGSAFDRGRVISEVAYGQSFPSVVDTGDGWLVAWVEVSPMTDRGSELRLRHVASDGTGGAEHVIGGARFAARPTLVRADDRALLAWEAEGGPFAVRVALDGAPVGEVLALGGGYSTLVASDGRDWIVTRTSPATSTIAVESILSGGRTFSIAGIDGRDVRETSLAWSGSVYLLTSLKRNPLLSRDTITVRPLDRDGQPLGTEAIVFEADGEIAGHTIVCGTEACVVAWSSPDGRIRTVPVADDGHAGAATILGAGTGVRVVALDGGIFFAIAGRNGWKFHADGKVIESGIVLDAETNLGDVVAAGSRIALAYSRQSAIEEGFNGAPRVLIRELRPSLVAHRRSVMR